MKPTLHAMYRWIEFYPEHDIGYQYSQSKGMSPKRRRLVLKQTPRWRDAILNYRGVYRLLAPCGALFVMRRPEIIIDVFPLNGSENLVPSTKSRQYTALVQERLAASKASQPEAREHE